YEQAACAGVDSFVFFDTTDLHNQAYVLKTFCAPCPVRELCETSARATGDYRWTVRGNRTQATEKGLQDWVQPDSPSCGSEAGLNKHRYDNTPLCTPCAVVQ